MLTHVGAFCFASPGGSRLRGMFCLVWAVCAAAALRAGGAPMAVDAAVARGSRWLRGALAREDFAHPSYPMGMRSLYLYALLSAGVDADQPVLREAIEAVTRIAPEQTYSVSLAVLMLDRLGRALGTVPLLASGADEAQFSFLGPHRELCRDLCAWLRDAAEPGRTLWTYRRGGAEHDHSNTQFAVHALTAVRGGGAYDEADLARAILATLPPAMGALEDVPPRTRVTVTLRAGGDGAPEAARTQWVAPGGWGYRAGEAPTFSMTCAGLAGLAAAARILERQGAWEGPAREAADAAMWSAMAYIAANWRELEALRPEARRVERRYYYTVYTLAKAADMAGIVRFGDRDWYAEESAFLLRDQHEDGRWGRDGWEGVATSFALLFLTRAAGRVRVEMYGDVGALLCAALDDDDPRLIEAARRAVEGSEPAQAGRLAATLLVLIRRGPRAVRTFAYEMLARVTGLRPGDAAGALRWARAFEQVRAVTDRRGAEVLCALARREEEGWERLRVEGVDGLARIGAAHKLDVLIGLLNDRVPAVRAAAYDALRRLGAPDVGFAAEGPLAARQEAFIAIAEWFRAEGRARALAVTVEDAVDALCAPAPPAVDGAAMAVLEAHREEALAALAARLAGPSVDVRVLEALARLGGEDLGIDPRRWRRWWSERAQPREGVHGR